MTEAEKRLFRQLNGANHLDAVAGGQVSTSSGVNAAISQIAGNPQFKAEITLQVFVRYYSQAVVGTPVVAVPAAGQQTNLHVYLFVNI